MLERGADQAAELGAGPGGDGLGHEERLEDAVVGQRREPVQAGGVIGTALLEQTITDHRDGRIVNANLADYLVPVNADIPDLQAIYLEGEDPDANSHRRVTALDLPGPGSR